MFQECVESDQQISHKHEIEIKHFYLELEWSSNLVYNLIRVFESTSKDIIAENGREWFMIDYNFNKTGLQPVSRPVEQILGFFLKV